MKTNKTTKEMLQEIKDFQNSKVPGVTLMHSDQETINWCIKLAHEIFIQKKHKYNLDK